MDIAGATGLLDATSAQAILKTAFPNRTEWADPSRFSHVYAVVSLGGEPPKRSLSAAPRLAALGYNQNASHVNVVTIASALTPALTAQRMSIVTITNMRVKGGTISSTSRNERYSRLLLSTSVGMHTPQ